jgi:glucosamine--fructose-6-phosphate aminotransferase (isomerizing)
MATLMAQEARQTPEVIAQQLTNRLTDWSAVVKHINKRKPRFVVTLGRGSSDHAASFAKYLLESRHGLITASIPPSVISHYQAQLDWRDSLVLAISQSGRSPDLLRVIEQASQQGAMTLALVNDPESPLGQAAQFMVPLRAGPEKAVAATKSYIASLSSLLILSALMSQDKALLSALQQLPDSLTANLQLDWSQALAGFSQATNALTLGRGYGFAIAQEAALKYKETACIHGEAFSGAEVLHGPFALMTTGLPVLMFLQQDNTLAAMLELADRIVQLGVPLAVVGDKTIAGLSPLLAKGSLHLPIVAAAANPLLEPLCAIQGFYLFADKLAAARGYNPDSPAYLQKVTQTL